jgi:hypothetical protein
VQKSHPDPSLQGEARPEASPHLSAREFDRWYWTKAELIAFARTLSIPTGGSKLEVAERIRSVLDGRPIATPKPRKRSRLSEPLSSNTEIPADVVLSRELRNWLTAQVGPSFHFNAHMRTFFSSRAGATLGDAVEHWHATKHMRPTEIAPQFELNRFTRQWRKDHPNGTHQELMAAWHHHRATPTDQRN